jgi:phosphatidylglycerol:prolipoprotein diacylglycerol transferase
MMPWLFHVTLFGWSIGLPTYGLVLASAFLLALAAALKQARKAGVEATTITDIWIACLLSGVVGAKLLLYLIDFDYYIAHPRAILSTLQSAGVFYGGLAAAIATCLVLVRRRGLDGWLLSDILAPGIILGQAVGRWGCFAAGCCYGKPSSLPWAVTFTDPAAKEITGVPLNVPLHPTQIYLSLADLALFFILIFAAARKKFGGQVFLLYLILYAGLRGTLEMFRGDPRGEFAGLSTSQVISIAAGIVGLALYMWRARTARVSAIQAGPRPRRGRSKVAPASTK